MKKILLAALFTLTSFFASADNVLYTWGDATVRTDGTPITGTKSYVLEVKKNTNPPTLHEVTSNSFVYENVVSGDVVVAKIATKEGLMQGPFSNEVVTPIPFYPAPPSDLKGTHVSVTFHVNVGVGAP